ncbi:transporter [Tamlana sp. s12]|uniref:transporter n=1 Tax=Tamlana sp. s12 TaxID=1630406 RepID=UPI0007FFC7DB|nr:transporter [Tamlana sp. s12]OBQ50152.1 hypothetical protein VQ01_15465 [Tamlana sp. s12]QQY81593.1 transporter [Tamlana sp. s12]
MKRILLLLITFSTLQIANAQGDGARMILWGPNGVTGVIPKWMSLNQNITPANILVKDADLHINAFPITAIHNFGIAGRFAQVMVNAVPGNVNGSAAIPETGTPIPTNITVNSSGFSDGFVGFKLGLINQPALNVKEYASYEHKTFSMTSYTRIWYSGSYEQNEELNLGSNRWTFELGLPMNIYLSKKNPKRATWLEVYPAIHLYTANNNPTTITKANKTEQLPLFSLENHFSHNFTDKLWASLDLRYQFGGELKADGVKQDNKINALGGGATVGYQIIPPLALHLSYGAVFNNASNVEANMFKVTLQFSYVNMKKLNTTAK